MTIAQIPGQSYPGTWTEADVELWEKGYQPTFVTLYKDQNGATKFYPQSGTTGGTAPFDKYERPSTGDVVQAIRVPKNVLMIDVDHGYDGKTGFNTLVKFAKTHGSLKPTWRITSRGVGNPNGKYLYRVPEGMTIDESVFAEFGGDIDILRNDHRWTWSPGENHPKTDTPVEVFDKDGNLSELPSVDQLPMLPVSWCSAKRVIKTATPDAPKVLNRNAAAAQTARAWAEVLKARPKTSTLRSSILGWAPMAARELLADGSTPAEVWDKLFRKLAEHPSWGDKSWEPGPTEAAIRWSITTAIKEPIKLVDDDFAEILGKQLAGLPEFQVPTEPSAQPSNGTSTNADDFFSGTYQAPTNGGVPADKPVVSTNGAKLEELFFGEELALAKSIKAEAVEAQARSNKDPLDDTPARHNMPEQFWQYNDTFKHIRQAAHARKRSADAVLGSVLSRISALVPPEMKVDIGLGPASLNTFVAVAGKSGKGKSASMRVARDIVPIPDYLVGDLFADNCKLSTGQGICEVFMGDIEQTFDVQVIDEKGDPVLDDYGLPKTKSKPKTIRTQVRKNAFFAMDEGEELVKINLQTGSTVNETLRSAAMAEALGQDNARKENTRKVADGSYSLGFSVGIQPQVADALINDHEAGVGTLQRFLWVSVYDPTTPVSEVSAVEWPGPLPMFIGQPFDGLPSATPDRALIPSQGWNMTAPDWIMKRYKMKQAMVTAGLLDEIPDEESHEDLLTLKVAALFTLLMREDHITEETWGYAQEFMEVSNKIRSGMDQIVRGIRSKKEAEADRKYQMREAGAEAAKIEVHNAANEKEQAEIEEAALIIYEKVKEGKATSKRDVSVASRKVRKHWDAASAMAVDMHWVNLDGNKLSLGASAPASK